MNANREAVVRMQKELPNIRFSAGWSLKDLANIICSTVLVAYNIEQGTIELSLWRYILIRYYYNEIANTKKDPNEKELMKFVMYALVDEGREKLNAHNKHQ